MAGRAALLGGREGEGPAIRGFGRLASGATLERAQAELATIGLRMSADFPETNRCLRPRVMPYTASFLGAPPLLLYVFHTFLTLTLVVVCANVATLVFARTATREREIAVRTALGASRGPILMQRFAEALVLAPRLRAVAPAVDPTLCLHGLRPLDKAVIQTARGAGIVVSVAALMIAVGLLACAVPARRAFRIEPTDARKEGG